VSQFDCGEARLRIRFRPQKNAHQSISIITITVITSGLCLAGAFTSPMPDINVKNMLVNPKTMSIAMAKARCARPMAATALAAASLVNMA
jgi:hypothetical protein